MKVKTTLLTLVASTALALTFTTTVNATTNQTNESTTNNEQSEFVKAYNEGRAKGILNDENMTKKDFLDLCKESVFPAYLNYVKDNPTTSFAQYIADDNYEVPEQQPDDHPTTVRANDEVDSNSSSPFVNLIAAHSGYSIKAGDILICYGTNIFADPEGKVLGHAAIASSSEYIMEMPGIGKGAVHTPKSTFFRQHTGNGSYVAVYRVKQHPKYADDASTFAYHNMYLKNNPSYAWTANPYCISPSYCSKYVYLAWYYGATRSSVKNYSGSHMFLPHSFIGNWSGSFKASYIHKITSN